MKLKLQYFGYLMRKADSLEKTLMLGKTEGRRRQQRMRQLDGTDSMDMSLSKLQEMVNVYCAKLSTIFGVYLCFKSDFLSLFKCLVSVSDDC